MRLPFRDDAVDLCYSSNVLEHVPDPWRMAEEMLRVTRPGGVAFISYTSWYGPWGGHETAPWHFLRAVHLLPPLVRPVGRPRDRPVALPGRRAGPPPLCPPARPRAQEQVRRVAVRAHREAGRPLGPPTAAR